MPKPLHEPSSTQKTTMKRYSRNNRYLCIKEFLFSDHSKACNNNAASLNALY